jgi:diguanylate cyclase (GGDEF)-like protein
MIKLGRLPLFILLINMIAFCGWSFLFSDDVWMKALGVSVLQLVAGTISTIWLYRCYQKVTNKERYFWLLLSIGMCIYLISDFIWFTEQVSEKLLVMSFVPYITRLISYCFFLAALIYKTKDLNKKLNKSSYLFNIFVFLITITVISIHYLINPIIAVSNQSLLMTVIILLYPIKDINIWFVITILYYLVQDSNEKSRMMLIIIGFTLQLTADIFYVVLMNNGSFQSGGITDFIWLFATLFIGSAGYGAKKSQTDLSVDIKNPFEKKESIFPYTSIIVLILLVIIDYDWALNTLSFGLLIIVLMIIARQILVMRKNNKLIAEYKFLAYQDALTGLYNRVSFKDDLEANIANFPKRKFALFLIDLDRFKVINDTLGHYIGDMILIKTAERLKSILNSDGQIYRLAGDEFVVILQTTSEDQCSFIAETILRYFQEPFFVNGYELLVTPSIGISIFPDQGGSSEELLKHADAAMYLAKESGKNSFRLFNSELNKTIIRKLEIEQQIKYAIERNQFSLYYQPKIELQTRKMIGMEALLRWNHPELGWISPGEFIPIAEETGQIVPIGEWVLNEACRQNKHWQEKGFKALCVSVNVSVWQFQHSDFITTVAKALQETKLDPRYLELEITESIMQNIRESTEVLQVLRNMGVKISIDDFGTGYSSLNLLQRLPIDTLKIDKSFIDDIGNSNQHCMVKTIVDLGLNLNLNIVAEGIEHEHQMKFLLESKCHIGQGYLFSKPLEVMEFEKFLLVNDFIEVEQLLFS